MTAYIQLLFSVSTELSNNNVWQTGYYVYHKWLLCSTHLKVCAGTSHLNANRL